MRRTVSRAALWTFAAVFLFASPAEANVMVPFVFAGWLAMIPALIPIVLIESAVLMRAGAHFWESHLAMSVANVASTLAGILLAIIIDVVLSITTSLYDLDDEDAPSNKWRVRVPVGGIFLLIPFFLLSWLIEAPIAIWILDDLSARTVNLAVRDGNIVTYALLGLFIGSLLTVLVWQFVKEASNKNRSNQSEALTESWPAANVRASMGIANLETTEVRIAPKSLVVIEGRSHPETMVEDQHEPDAWSAEATKRVSKAG